jgi:hypothetical protein
VRKAKTISISHAILNTSGTESLKLSYTVETCIAFMKVKAISQYRSARTPSLFTPHTAIHLPSLLDFLLQMEQLHDPALFINVHKTPIMNKGQQV